MLLSSLGSSERPKIIRSFLLLWFYKSSILFESDVMMASRQLVLLLFSFITAQGEPNARESPRMLASPIMALHNGSRYNANRIGDIGQPCRMDRVTAMRAVHFAVDQEPRRDVTVAQLHIP